MCSIVYITAPVLHHSIIQLLFAVTNYTETGWNLNKYWCTSGEKMEEKKKLIGFFCRWGGGKFGTLNWQMQWCREVYAWNCCFVCNLAFICSEMSNCLKFATDTHRHKHMCNRRTQIHQIQMHATNPNDVTEQDEHGNNHTCMRHTPTHTHTHTHT